MEGKLSNDKIRIDENQYKQCMKIFGQCYNDNLNNLRYFPCSGIMKSKLTTYTEFIHDRAKIFFRILEKCKIPYLVFAGSSIGYMRNKRNIPWADDYDIIIFSEYVTLFMQKAMPILILNEFNYFKRLY